MPDLNRTREIAWELHELASGVVSDFAPNVLFGSHQRCTICDRSSFANRGVIDHEDDCWVGKLSAALDKVEAELRAPSPVEG